MKAKSIKTYKRAQSTLDYEYGFLRKHPECRIYKDKHEETYIWQASEHVPASIISLYFGKLGNIAAVHVADANGDLYKILELRT